MFEAALYGAFAPFILVFVESILPFASFFEEATKALILWLNPHKLLKHRLIQAVLVGTLFTITEAVLYSTLLFNLGNRDITITRLIFTLKLHVSTSLLLSLPKSNQHIYRIIALILAIGIHIFYNNYFTAYLLSNLH